MVITSYSVIKCKVLYSTGPAEVRLGFHPVESLGRLAQPDALSSLHPPLKVLIRKEIIDFSPEFLIHIRIKLVNESGSRQAKIVPQQRKT